MAVIKINDPQKCTGCATCAGCCPQGAISFREDERGFRYPFIEEKKCIQCGECSIICKKIEEFAKQLSGRKPLSAYAMKHIDEDIHKQSQSGGVFYQLGKMFIRNGGIVFGAAFSDDFSVSHICIEKEEDLHLLQGSKYVQSNMGMIVSQVVSFIRQGKPVLFSGTPCQCAGVRCACDGMEDKLLLVDLLCHGVPTPKLWKDYIGYMARKHHGKVEDVCFRVSDGSQKKGHEERFTIGGRSYRTVAYGQMFYSHAFFRDSCDYCEYRIIGRAGDITLGDWIHGKKTGHPFWDNRGVSQVFANSDKGMEWIDLIKDSFENIELSLEECIQPSIENKYDVNEKKTFIFEEYINHGIDEIVRKYGHENRFVRIRRVARKVLIRLKLLRH